MNKSSSSDHFSYLKRNDREVYNILEKELNREHNTLELIASENFASYAVLEMTGSVLTNMQKATQVQDIMVAVSM